MAKTQLHRAAASLLLALASLGLMAQIPNGYYDNANGKTGDELKEALHDIIKGHTAVGYNNVWNAFWSTDNKGNGVVWDMYSDNPDGTPAYTFQLGQDNCDNDGCESEGGCYNREHSWPQSWFGNQTTPGSDLHHVFPTDCYVNQRRSNYPYGEVGTATWTSSNGSKLGTSSTSGYSGTVFEPVDEYKGDFARELFYISVRYYGEDSNWSTSGMTNKSEIEPWAIQMLMRWNDNDPVSQKEMDRNNAIYNDYQHNRNPFVDHPEYARMIWDPNWHEGLGGYEKVTSTDDITDGDYLIVYEEGSLAFDGSLTKLDVLGNTIEVSIFNDNIESNASTDVSAFTISSMANGFSIKSASGYYIGNTSDANALKTSLTVPYANTITISEDGNAEIVSSSSRLRFNSDSDQNRFRYYKSSTYTSQKAIRLYKKIEVYGISLASVENGSISADAEEAIEGTVITLTATPDAGYELDHWAVTDAMNNNIPVNDNQFEMPASNVTVSAVFVYVGEPFAQKYYLVTSTDQLVAGRTYLIVNTENSKALGKTQNANNRSAATIAIANNTISTLGDACELTLGGQAGAWTLYDATNNSGYLYAAGGSSNNNYLKTQTTLTNAGKWTISLNGTNKATIKTIDPNVNRHTIMYNNSGSIFSCYASGQNEVCLFIRSEEYTHTESETIAHLFAFDKHTISNGVTLSVSGTAACHDANHLVIEDGGQFVHSDANVQATLKKHIQAYSDNSGWYTVASPFVSYAPAGLMTSNDYDLYYYSESGPLEWKNHKQGSGFNMVSGQGYLYAHNPATTLRMAGVLNSGNHSETVGLGYANSDANLKGFNLLGNPTAHEINFTATEQVSDGYYYIHNGDGWAYSPYNTVPAGRGFLVKANAESQSVTLNPQSDRGESPECNKYLCISVDDEKAYIKLNEGVSMPLIDLQGRHAGLYLLRGQKPYVMLVRDGADFVDLNFEPKRNGEHTLSVDIQGLDLDYLHLIDNMTGVDVDLLHPGTFIAGGTSFRESGTLIAGEAPQSLTPSYTFTAKTTDYESRFRLVFICGDANGDDKDAPFAYYANGEIIITDGLSTGSGACATLQVVDMMGRVIFSGDGVCTVSTNGLAKGLYILRMTTNNDVKVQKIVVD